MTSNRRSVLITGASGYVGGRLLPLLEVRGHAVRCLARRPENLLPRVAAGILSFELIRALMQRLPVMVCPRWVQVPPEP